MTVAVREAERAEGTLKAMDRVRFGRALGYGARHAVRTLAQAAEAATTPATGERATPGADPKASPRADAAQRPAAPVQERLRQAAVQAGRQKGAVMGPIKRLSGVLWLEVTGSFFALVAVALSRVAWTMRTTVQHAPRSAEAVKAYIALGMMALFAYFAISSFVRARRRERQAR